MNRTFVFRAQEDETKASQVQLDGPAAVEMISGLVLILSTH